MALFRLCYVAVKALAVRRRAGASKALLRLCYGSVKALTVRRRAGVQKKTVSFWSEVNSNPDKYSLLLNPKP